MIAIILYMIDDRRKHKNKNVLEFNQKNREIKNAKEQWLHDKCKEI